MSWFSLDWHHFYHKQLFSHNFIVVLIPCTPLMDYSSIFSFRFLMLNSKQKKVEWLKVHFIVISYQPPLDFCAFLRFIFVIALLMAKNEHPKWYFMVFLHIKDNEIHGKDKFINYDIHIFKFLHFCNEQQKKRENKKKKKNNNNNKWMKKKKP